MAEHKARFFDHSSKFDKESTQDTDSLSKTLPCPFCSSENLVFMGDYIRCIQCKTEGPYLKEDSLSEEEQLVEIIKRWNTRYLTKEQI